MNELLLLTPRAAVGVVAAVLAIWLLDPSNANAMLGFGITAFALGVLLATLVSWLLGSLGRRKGKAEPDADR